ncbi:MAG: hypothetical protein A2Z45_07405 [Chloroflexi bacterium RBG_19FT_COMBO_55_16]|nr:MAG: hypothetical protein A2Z45_07405 [Chloroflexi bacterium RBG_19FT_COMBO_55_16]
MTDKSVIQNFSENPDAQEKRVSREDITPSLEPRLPDRLPQSLIEWLARINRRYLALNQEKTNNTSECISRAAPGLNVSCEMF